MEQEIVRIDSLADYVEQVNNIHLTPEIRSMPPKLLFRGHSNIAYELVPSLGRCPSQFWMNSWQMEELGLVQTAQQKFPNVLPQSAYPALLLAKLQHYGIYTRMLDLSDNALVAMYFACCGNPECDGEIFAFSVNPVSVFDPFVNAIADTYRLTKGADIDFANLCYKIKNQTYYSSCRYPVLDDDSDKLQDYLEPSFTRPICVEAGSVCERQKNQGGYFLLFPNQLYYREEGEPDTVPERTVSSHLIELSKDNEMIVKRFVISKEEKQTVLKQLNRFGITNEFLFADSIDEVCRGIMQEYREHYPDN